MIALGQDEVARRFSHKELDGVFTKDVRVDTGHLALLLLNGAFERVLEPGTHRLGSFWKSLSHLGRSREEVVLVRCGEISVDFHLPDLLTADPLFLEQDGVLILQYKREAEGEFLANLMPGRECLTFTDLRALVFAALQDTAGIWFSQRQFEQLLANPEVSDLREELTEAVRRPLIGKGIGLVRLDLRQWHVFAWDDKTRRLAETTQAVWEAESEQERGKRLSEVSKLLGEQPILEHETELATNQRRVQVWNRLQQAFDSAEMSQLRSERQIEDIIHSVDRDKLLRRADIERFKSAIRMEREEEKTKTYLIGLTEVERDYEYRQMESRRFGMLLADLELTASQMRKEENLERIVGLLGDLRSLLDEKALSLQQSIGSAERRQMLEKLIIDSASSSSPHVSELVEAIRKEMRKRDVNVDAIKSLARDADTSQQALLQAKNFGFSRSKWIADEAGQTVSDLCGRARELLTD